MRDAVEVQALLAAVARRPNLQQLTVTLEDGDQHEQLATVALLVQLLPQLRSLYLDIDVLTPTHLLPMVRCIGCRVSAPPPPCHSSVLRVAEG